MSDKNEVETFRALIQQMRQPPSSPLALRVTGAELRKLLEAYAVKCEQIREKQAQAFEASLGKPATVTPSVAARLAMLRNGLPINPDEQPQADAERLAHERELLNQALDYYTQRAAWMRSVAAHLVAGPDDVVTLDTLEDRAFFRDLVVCNPMRTSHGPYGDIGTL